MSFETLQSKILHRGRVFNLRQDRVRLPNGDLFDYDILEHGGAVTLLPLDKRNHIWFIRQYRQAAGQMILELPAGTLEAGESPLENAHREIREEIGMQAGEFRKLGEFFLAPGYSTEYMHLYLAIDLTPAPLPGDEDEVITVERIAVARAYQLAQEGGIQDAKSLAALLLARPFLENT
jgi:ADP-ribose pyrophosphatase